MEGEEEGDLVAEEEGREGFGSTTKSSGWMWTAGLVTFFMAALF